MRQLADSQREEEVWWSRRARAPGRRSLSKELGAVLEEAARLLGVVWKCLPKMAMRKPHVKKLRDGGQSQCLELQKPGVKKKSVKKIQHTGMGTRMEKLNFHLGKWKHT